MTTSPVLFIVIAFPIVFSQANNNDNAELLGISSYCETSRQHPLWYPPTPVECCDHRGQCEDFIKPNETRFGLTNLDRNWLRRHCTCDLRLWHCVSGPMTLNYENILKREFAFNQEVCFRNARRLVNGKITMDHFEFVPVIHVLFNSPAARISLAGKLLRPPTN